MFVADSHCHLESLTLLPYTYPQLICIPSITLDDANELHQYRKNHNNAKIGIGLHPWFIDAVSNKEELQQKLEASIEKYKPDFIGECGLDYYKPNVNMQLEYLKVHLATANKYDLPIILHCVKAYADMIQLLKEFQPRRGIIHAFNGSHEIACELIKQNMFLGIGSIITKPNNKLFDVIANIPLAKLVIESDAPFMPIYGETKFSPYSTFLYAQILALSKNINLIDCIKQVNNNLTKLFITS